MKPVAVTHESDHYIIVVARFDTVLEAEQFIADREKLDPLGVYDGDYGVDAPEEMNNG
jgi:hypothetical protein